MSREIQNGTILIAQGAQVPVSIQMEEESYVEGWQLTSRLDQTGLLRLNHCAGWKLFFFDPTVERRVFGFDDNKAIREAIRRIVATIRAKSFNCLEIKRVEMRRCLGFPFVLVAARSWHIQASSALIADAL